MSNEKDTLSLYGGEFQSAVISGLMTDGDFLVTVHDILDSDYFESQAHKWIVNEIQKYYQEFNHVPTFQVFKVKVADLENKILKKSVVDHLRQIHTLVGNSDIEFVKDKFLDFCKTQKLKTAILESADLIGTGDYDQIRTKIDEATRAGTKEKLGLLFSSNIDFALSEESRRTVPTGWDVIDELIGGGLSGGELGVAIGSSGSGKSWILCNIGLAAALRETTVAHYTLELGDSYTMRRYYTTLSRIHDHKLFENIDKLRPMVERIGDKIIVTQYPTKSASAQTIMADMKRLRIMGRSPGLIIVDYADLLRPSRKLSDSKYEELGGIYEELRQVSGELDIPIWTVSQANRNAIDMEVIQADSIADSYQKVMTADFVFSISRKAKDKVANTARIHIIKNRFGMDGMTFPAKMDASIGLIDIFHPNSPNGIITEKESSNGDMLQRKIMAKKFKELD